MTMDVGMWSSSRSPSGPLRQRKIETKRPTTTGGRPIPVLISATVIERPGNCVSARKIPIGMPNRRDSSVALPEILSESHVMAQISGSPVKRSQNACPMPSQMSSMSASDLLFPLSRDGDEQRLPVFLHTEALDYGLGLWGDHEIGEGLSSSGVNSRSIGRIHLHHRIDVQERLVSLQQNDKGQSFLKG